MASEVCRNALVMKNDSVASGVRFIKLWVWRKVASRPTVSVGTPVMPIGDSTPTHQSPPSGVAANCAVAKPSEGTTSEPSKEYTSASRRAAPKSVWRARPS